MMGPMTVAASGYDSRCNDEEQKKNVKKTHGGKKVVEKTRGQEKNEMLEKNDRYLYNDVYIS
jgi:hypothetical protein